MSKKIIRHELVSVLIPANSTNTRFVIPDLSNLRNVLTFGLQVYTIDEVAKDIISQNPVLSHTAVLHNSFLTFVNYGGKEFIKQAPSIMFNTLNNNANASTNWNEQDFKSLVGQRINFPKSFIEFTTPPATTVDTAFIFSVYYSLPILEEQKESGYSFGNKG
jgi:hypothetical protein